MLYNFLLVVLVLAALVAIISILMQAGKGGGLAANFGGAGSSSDAFLGSRQASTFITKTSWIAGGIFLALSYILSIAGSRPGPVNSILSDIQPPASAPPAAPLGGAGAGMQGAPPIPGKSDTGTASSAGKVPPL